MAREPGAYDIDELNRVLLKRECFRQLQSKRLDRIAIRFHQGTSLGGGLR